MKPKFYTKLITLLAGFMMLANVNVATAQTVNMERWIELTVKKDANIGLILAGDTDNTAVKIESGSTNETIVVNASWGQYPSLQFFLAGATTMKIYGNVKAFACGTNNENITGVNVLNNTGLVELHCNSNNISSLDLTGLTKLQNLYCYNNNLTSLDVSGCTALEVLWCYNSNLTSLDVSGCTALEILNCKENNLTALDISGSTALTFLNCNENNLTSLNLIECTALEEFYCRNNSLTSLNLSGCSALKIAGIRGNKFTTQEIEKIYCSLPQREEADMARIIVLQNESDPNKEIVMATTKRNATDKNWNVSYAGAENTPIGETSGSYTCPALETYPLWVAGTQVTNHNSSYILGDSKVSYDPASTTLTLNGATIDGGANNGIFNEGIDNLKIELIGNNTVSNTAESGNSAISLLKNTTIAGTGTLTVQAKYVAILFNACNLNIEDGCTVTAISEKWGVSGAGTTEVLTVKNSTLKATGASPYSIGGIDDLILEGCEITQPAGAAFARKFISGITIGAVFLGDNIVDSEVIIAPIYELFIKGVQVNIQNENDILGDGTVKYAPTDKILTLTDVNIDDMGIGIYNKGIEGLTINVIGDNNNIATQGGALYLMKSTTITGSGTLKTSGDFSNISLSNCNLTIKDGCTVTAYSQSDRAISGVSGTEQLIINNSTVKATGAMTGSIGNLAELILEDCKIVSPAGAKWDATQKAVVDSEGNVVTVEVVIRKLENYIITYVESSTEGNVKVYNGGTLISNGTAVKEGTELTVEAIPNDGYKLKSILANSKDITESKSFTVTEATEVKVEFSSTSGVNDVETEHLLSIYPNPAREHITIKIADDLKAETLYIIDISGRIIRTEPISDSTMTLDVSKYAKGIYLIKAGKVNRRLIIK